MTIGETRSARRVPDRRGLLVRAAFEAIAEKGFGGLRLRAVAAQAGIDHSTLHHYFPTRRDLVAAVVELATGQFRTTMRDGGAHQLDTHLAILARMLKEQPALFIVLREIDLQASRDPVVRDIVDRHERGWRAALAGVLGGDDSADDSVELVIATVKGVSFIPDRASEVLERLGHLLTQEHP